MRQTPLIAATAAVLLLTLTGCTGTPASAPSATQSGNVKVEAQKQGTPTVAPLVAETPAASASGDAEALFLKRFHEIRATRPGPSQIPNATDDQLLEAAHKACDRMAAGEDSGDLSVIEGETRNAAGTYSDSGSIVTAARQSICPR